MPSRSSEPAAARPKAAFDAVAWAILAFTLLVRGGVLLAFNGAFNADPDGYRALASNLLEYGVFGAGRRPSAYRPPLYPLLLVPCETLDHEAQSRIALGLLHVSLGAATALVTLWLGRRWGLGRWSALAAALTACDPILLNQSTLVMTETLAAFLACAALAALTWTEARPGAKRAALAGIALGLAALCRPTFLAWAALAALAWVVLRQRRRRLVVPFALLVSLVLTLAPWMLRNLLQFGRPIATTTHGGYTLLLGNNPEYYAFLEQAGWGDVWQADQFDREVSLARAEAGDNEVSADQREYAQAWQAIGAHPRPFLKASVARLGNFWGVLPHRTGEDRGLRRHALRYAAASWYSAEFVLAVAGLCILRSRLWRSAWLWGVLLAASLTSVHALYWSDMRMRAPLAAVVALLAARGFASFWDRALRRKTASALDLKTDSPA
jgi:4-amino-4-deoxy-L-arabinose transferase-like glycosyltransferase